MKPLCYIAMCVPLAPRSRKLSKGSADGNSGCSVVLAMEKDKTALTLEDAVNAEEKMLPTYSEDGVDLTLIRWMLSFTPLERLRIMQRYAASTYRLQNAGKKLRL